jgi:hypothetical protein
MATDKSMELAHQINQLFEDHLHRSDIGPHETTRAITEMVRKHATPPPGCVRTHEGRDVRVLGELPMTADGCVATHSKFLYHPDSGPCYMVPDGHDRPSAAKVFGGAILVSVSECYSSEQAAEAARSSKA